MSLIRKFFEKSVILILLFFILHAVMLRAQPEKTDSTFVNQKDIIDFLQHNFGLHLRKENSSLKGNGPFISVMPVLGYSLQSGLTGAIVSNTSFYTDSSRNKFSNLLVNGYYSEYQQYWFTANSNIFFEKKKLHLFGDIRYYNFPTKTYGIGTNSSLSDGLNIKYSYLRFYQIAFREIKPNVFAGLGYNLDYHWNIKIDSIQGKPLDDFKNYQSNSQSISSGVSLNLLFDNRKNAVNPSQGIYAFLQYRPNLTLLGSDSNWQSFQIDIRNYLTFPAASHNILAFWSYNNFTLKGTPPYLDTPSVGWDYYSNTGRGYVPGRYTGRNFIYLESEYRFPLTRNGFLGGVVFGNVESIFVNWSDPHSIVAGEGIGLRIKINKYSNTNIVIDYGFGVGGSHGLFFNLGEVF